MHTELGDLNLGPAQLSVHRSGPRLRSSGAHWAGQVPGWGPAVHTELGRSQVEVQRCTLSSDVGEELGEELAESLAKSLAEEDEDEDEDDEEES